MAKGHAQSDATKKKISDALKKGGGATPPPSEPHRSPEAQKLFGRFTAAQNNSNAIKQSMSDLNDKLGSIPKGKTNKAKKDKIHAQIKELAKQHKAAIVIMKGIKAVAQRLQQVHASKVAIQNSKNRIAHSTSNLSRAKQTQARIGDLMGKAKTPQARERLQQSLSRLQDSNKRNQDAVTKDTKSIADHTAIIKAGGVTVKRAMFNFSEAPNYLHENKFVIWRDLTLQEERVNFKALSEVFNNFQSQIRDELAQTVQQSINKGLAATQNRLKAGDILAIASLMFVAKSVIEPIINKFIKKSYEEGKKSASSELKVGQPTTPLKKTQLMNLDSDMIAESFSTDIDLNVKQKIKDGISKDVADVAILAAIASVAQDRSAKMINSLAANIVGENLNKGRRTVFEANAISIQGYQRSEVLDGRTCDMCMSLDGSVITADDQMAQLDEVHDNCRGVWVPILQGENMPDDPGLDPEVADAFDTMGGAPMVNAFKQLKKPINDLSRDAIDEVKRRMQDDANLGD